MAREKLDRQLARRAARTRRRRQTQAGIGAAVALLLIVGGAAWLGGVFDSDPEDAANEATDDVCTWIPQSISDNDKLKDVGTPPTTGILQSGTQPMTITTNQGAPITVSLDLTGSPCGAASLAYLASKKFYDKTTCHELTTEGALRCGDPSGTGLGGPTYTFPTENAPDPAPVPSASAAPTGQPPSYPKGTVALIGTPPGSNSSQFLIFFKDFTPPTPQYSIVGTVTGGLDVLAKISKLPVVDNGSGAKIKPKNDVLVQSLTVGEPAGLAPPVSSGAPSAAPSASGQS
jgi:peptidyl-prolyl cis-trans isomerase B (cyclophilin B)